MRDWLIRFWRKLDRRLVAIICATIMPINMLAIFFSTIATNEAKEKVGLYSQNEFERFLGDENTLCRAIIDWYSRYETAHIHQLAFPRGFNAVNSINMINAMGNELSEIGAEGFVLLVEKQEEERVYLKGTRALYSEKQIRELRTALLARIDAYAQERFVHLSERWYYVQYFDYRNYTVGLALDLQRQAERLRQFQLLSECNLLIHDGETFILVDSAETLSAADNQFASQFQDENPDMLSGRISVATAGIDVYLSDDWQPSTTPNAYLLLQFIAWCSGVLIVVLWYTIRRLVLHPLRSLQSGIERLESDKAYRIIAKAKTEDFRYIYDAFNKMAADLQQSHKRDILLIQTQLDNLKLQVNPHMLLNSLTMIYSMAETNQTALIQRFTMSLVGYFRYCLKETDTLVPLQSEMQFVGNYIEIQKMRFPGEISSTYLIEDGMERALVPRLIIQNFVENATKYGRLINQVMEVLIWVRSENNQLAVTIRDTGRGMNAELLERLNDGEAYTDCDGTRHIGIWNCRRRLAAFFGDDATIEITSTNGEGTQVEIRMPICFAQKE